MGTLRLIVSTLLLFGLVAASDFGEAGTIAIVPVGAAKYSITATDLQEAAGIELSILYDKDALENPTVTYGAMTAGALPAQNVTVPGSIRIVFITTGVIKGSGELASITFISKGKPQAWQPNFSPPPAVYAANGSPLAVQSVVTSSSSAASEKREDGAVKNGSEDSAGAMTTTPGTAAPVTIQSGTSFVANMTLPPASGDQSTTVDDTVRKDAAQEEPEYQNVPAESVVISATEEAAVALPAADKAAGERWTAALKSTQSVQEQFRTYTGVRTIARLASLFDRKSLSAAGVTQTPEIVVTDGVSLVTVALELANETDTPSFSLKGANMKSIREVSGNKWELNALPQKNKSDVRLSIIIKGERIEITLVAVPPLNQVGVALLALSDAALDDQLVKPHTDNTLAYDVNSDGKQDYLDDYILVAHWLLKLKSGAKQEDKAARLPAKNGSSK
ncbi:MAG: cohesin domain-containing protein [Desulfuromonadaceae bacterium]|nr:cohesin domain-containing protein [Desulfuromonadaceae bacterium]